MKESMAPFDDRWAAVLSPKMGDERTSAGEKSGSASKGARGNGSDLAKLPDLAEDLTAFVEEVVPKPGDKGTHTARVLDEIAKEEAAKRAGEDVWPV